MINRWTGLQTPNDVPIGYIAAMCKGKQVPFYISGTDPQYQDIVITPTSYDMQQNTVPLILKNAKINWTGDQALLMPFTDLASARAQVTTWNNDASSGAMDMVSLVAKMGDEPYKTKALSLLDQLYGPDNYPPNPDPNDQSNGWGSYQSTLIISKQNEMNRKAGAKYVYPWIDPRPGKHDPLTQDQLYLIGNYGGRNTGSPIQWIGPEGDPWHRIAIGTAFVVGSIALVAATAGAASGIIAGATPTVGGITATIAGASTVGKQAAALTDNQHINGTPAQLNPYSGMTLARPPSSPVTQAPIPVQNQSIHPAIPFAALLAIFL